MPAAITPQFLRAGVTDGIQLGRNVSRARHERAREKIAPDRELAARVITALDNCGIRRGAGLILLRLDEAKSGMLRSNSIEGQ
jgi:hypothetical protein